MFDSLFEVIKPEKPKGPTTTPSDAGLSGAKKRAMAAVDAAAAKKKASVEKRRQTIEKQRKAKFKAAVAANREKRAAQKKANAAAASTEKPDTKSAPADAGGSAADRIPAQVAHCVLAVSQKGGKSVRAAWNICRWSLTKHGYLKGPYKKNGKLPQAVAQTGKGSRRSFQHGMEKKPLGGGVPGNGSSKFNQFKALFAKIEPSVTAKE